MTYCFIGSDPTCENLECDKSNEHAKVLFVVFISGPYIIPPCVITATMFLIIRLVLAQEKKTSKYGINLKRIRLAKSVQTPPLSSGKP
jgi:hypothetical protein